MWRIPFKRFLVLFGVGERDAVVLHVELGVEATAKTEKNTNFEKEDAIFLTYMKTSPRIQMGPMGGGTSRPMKPERQMVLPIWVIFMT